MGLQMWKEKLPPGIVAIQAKLDPEKQEAFARDYVKRRKSLLIAYPLFLLGWHYLYLGKLGHQILFLIELGKEKCTHAFESISQGNCSHSPCFRALSALIAARPPLTQQTRFDSD